MSKRTRTRCRPSFARPRGDRPQDRRFVPTGPAIDLSYPVLVEPPLTIMVEDIHDPVDDYHQHIDLIYVSRPVGTPGPLNDGWIWVSKEELAAGTGPRPGTPGRGSRRPRRSECCRSRPSRWRRTICRSESSRVRLNTRPRPACCRPERSEGPGAGNDRREIPSCRAPAPGPSRCPGRQVFPALLHDFPHRQPLGCHCSEFL